MNCQVSIEEMINGIEIELKALKIMFGLLERNIFSLSLIIVFKDNLDLIVSCLMKD